MSLVLWSASEMIQKTFYLPQHSNSVIICPSTAYKNEEHRRRSSVNFGGGKTFLSEIICTRSTFKVTWPRNVTSWEQIMWLAGHLALLWIWVHDSDPSALRTPLPVRRVDDRGFVFWLLTVCMTKTYLAASSPVHCCQSRVICPFIRHQLPVLAYRSNRWKVESLTSNFQFVFRSHATQRMGERCRVGRVGHGGAWPNQNFSWMSQLTMNLAPTVIYWLTSLLLLKKIGKIGVIRRQILRLKCTPNSRSPRWGSLQRSPDPLAVFKRPTSG